MTIEKICGGICSEEIELILILYLYLHDIDKPRSGHAILVHIITIHNLPISSVPIRILALLVVSRIPLLMQALLLRLQYNI